MAEEGKKLKDKHDGEDFIVIGMFVLDALRDGIINKAEFAAYAKLCSMTYLKDSFFAVSAGEIGKGLNLRLTAVREALWGLRDKGFVIRGESEIGKSATWKIMRSSVQAREAAVRRKGKKALNLLVNNPVKRGRKSANPNGFPVGSNGSPSRKSDTPPTGNPARLERGNEINKISSRKSRHFPSSPENDKGLDSDFEPPSRSLTDQEEKSLIEAQEKLEAKRAKLGVKQKASIRGKS